ncbi:MAG: TetR/AcrR family transcriptional regulator [Candidatus Krumholzibacteria bacterium]|nr:TetR/AcrR family transcriptional regulator [Candidatus Krumholzibacteria bacterium]
MKKFKDPRTFECKNRDECCERILASANDLISEIGYEGMTMGMVAKRSGISMKRLLSQFHNKQNVLDELVVCHINIHEGIRAFTRTNPRNSPLQSFRIEWELLCEYMSHHVATLQAYMRYETDCAPWIRDRIELHRNQDIDLLEKACNLGELPPLNVASLESVLRGTVWNLIFKSAQKKEKPVDFSSIPREVSAMVLHPLMH